MATTWASSRDYMIFVLMTGMRKHEAMSLKWADIDFGAKTIEVPAKLCKNAHGYALPMSKFLEQFLRHRKRITGESEYLFPGQSGKGRLRSCQRVTEEVIKKCGQKFIMNDLRRTFQHAGLQAGVSAHLVKLLINCSGSRSSVDLLHEPNQDELRAAMEKISRRLLDKMSTNTQAN